MVPNFTTLLVMSVIAVGIALGAVLFTHIFGPKKYTSIKNEMPYESGRDPSGDARFRFNVHFYLVAVTFVVFDLEVVYFYPWALVYRDLISQSAGILVAMAIFASILVLGLVYEWKKGALDWR